MATVYVSPTGSDSNTYVQAQSSSTPWQTIGKCNTSATTGDTIICLSGTHTWASVAFTKNFTIQASTYGTVIFDAAGGAVGWSGLTAPVYTNLIFQNSDGYLPAGGGGIFVKANADSSAITATNCKFDVNIRNTTTAGGIFGTLDNHNNGAHVVTLTNCEIVAERATTNSTSLSAIFMARSTVNSIYTINGCTIYLPGTSGASTQIGSIFSNMSTYTTGSLVLKNTIIMCPTTAAAWLQGTAATTTSATYCDFYQVTSSPSGTGTITSDPLFVDHANLNFNLRPTSPCIDTGTLV